MKEVNNTRLASRGRCEAMKCGGDLRQQAVDGGKKISGGRGGGGNAVQEGGGHEVAGVWESGG